jgi:hypothetical protein
MSAGFSLCNSATKRKLCLRKLEMANVSRDVPLPAEAGRSLMPTKVGAPYANFAFTFFGSFSKTMSYESLIKRFNSETRSAPGFSIVTQ